MKKVLIPYSGGLDSTYLVYKNLKEGNEVYPIYNEIVNNVNKIKIEIQQSKKLIELFQKDFDYKIKDFNKVIAFESFDTSYILFKQPAVWILGLLYSSAIDYVDEIHMGYVMSDQAISYLSDIKKIYNSYQPLFDKKLPTLKFPLSKTSKQEIWNTLPEKYRNLTITCENPTIEETNENTNIIKEGYLGTDKKVKEDIKYEPCYKCDSCKRQINEGFLKDNNPSINYDYVDKAENEKLSELEWMKKYNNTEELKLEL